MSPHYKEPEFERFIFNNWRNDVELKINDSEIITISNGETLRDSLGNLRGSLCIWGVQLFSQFSSCKSNLWTSSSRNIKRWLWLIGSTRTPSTIHGCSGFCSFSSSLFGVICSSPHTWREKKFRKAFFQLVAGWSWRIWWSLSQSSWGCSWSSSYAPPLDWRLEFVSLWRACHHCYRQSCLK